MKSLFVLFLSFLVGGCASLADAPKNVVGVSTRDMEEARGRSVYQSYACQMDECFTSLISIAEKNGYYVFMKDEVRGLVILMNIPGQVDTTEVGVFLTGVRDGIKVELSSRSSSAKRSAARVLFAELAQKFSAI